MGKKKKRAVQVFDNHIIEYTENGQTIRLIRLNLQNMTVDVRISETGKEACTATIPFAHLPKKVKQQIRPL